MKKKSHNELTLEYYISQFHETKDPAIALAMAEMVDSGIAYMKIHKSKTELTFFEKSKCDNTCSRCGTKYLKDTACFYMDKKGWHPECGTEAEKENSYYKRWLKKQTSGLETKQSDPRIFTFN